MWPAGLPSMEILWVWLRLGSNEKVEMTLSTSEQTGRGPLGAHLRFLPWLCLTRGGLEPFMGRPSNLEAFRDAWMTTAS